MQFNEEFVLEDICDNYNAYKKNTKTNLLEEHVNFVDTTKKLNEYFKIFIIFLMVILGLFLFFVLFKHVNE